MSMKEEYQKELQEPLDEWGVGCPLHTVSRILSQ